MFSKEYSTSWQVRQISNLNWQACDAECHTHIHTHARSDIIEFFPIYDELVVTTKLVQSAGRGLHSLTTCSVVDVYLIATQHVLQ